MSWYLPINTDVMPLKEQSVLGKTIFYLGLPHVTQIFLSGNGIGYCINVILLSTYYVMLGPTQNYQHGHIFMVSMILTNPHFCRQGLESSSIRSPINVGAGNIMDYLDCMSHQHLNIIVVSPHIFQKHEKRE